MVVSRKPKKTSRGGRRETLDEKFQRLLALPVDEPFPKLTKRESRYFLRRLWETGEPDSGPDGAAIMREFYGLPQDEPDLATER